VEEMSLEEGMSVVQHIRERLEREFGIVHATLELEAR
jgi:hypothetical protein